MSRKRKNPILKKSIEEISNELGNEGIDVFDYLGEFLEGLEDTILHSSSMGYAPVRNAQVKIKYIFDYLSRPENNQKIINKNLEYFRNLYNQILSSHKLRFDDQGLVIGGGIRKFAYTTYSPYSKTYVEDPYRSFRR